MPLPLPYGSLEWSEEMKTVKEIAEEIVAREGGYVNDPDDPGGATKYGVTLGTMQRLGLDLTRDRRVTDDGVLVIEALHTAAAQAALDHLLHGELANAGVADRQVFSACFQLDRRLAGLP